MERHVISFRGRDSSNSLKARLVWQELYNVYAAGGGRLDHLDNMLVDYTDLIQYFERCESFCVLWSFYYDCTRMREVTLEYDLDYAELSMLTDHYIMIEYDVEKYEVKLTERQIRES